MYKIKSHTINTHTHSLKWARGSKDRAGAYHVAGQPKGEGDPQMKHP